MANHSKFRRGETTFTCNCCKRLTRYTGVQSVGAEVCPQCYELGGLENAVQDNCWEPSYTAAAKGELKDLRDKGIPVERLRKLFDLLPEEVFADL